MKPFLFPLFIIIGLITGWLFPFYALSLSKWAFIFLIFLLFINILTVNLKFKDLFSYTALDAYFIFFAYFFIPSLLFMGATFLRISHEIKLGFFATSLAPFAIITPQFLKHSDEKQLALKQVLLATFLFPFYFAAMIYLFFSQTMYFDILSIIRDSMLLTLLPLVTVFILNGFFHNLKTKLNLLLTPHLPMLNMMLIGILSFIFVGSSYLKNDLFNITRFNWLIILLLAVAQDFGVYYFSKLFKMTRTHEIVVSMKNVPFVGIFALLFFPKALISIMAVLFIHVFLIWFHSFNLKKIS